VPAFLVRPESDPDYAAGGATDAELASLETQLEAAIEAGDDDAAAALNAEITARTNAISAVQASATKALKRVPARHFTAAHLFGNSYVEGAGTGVIPAHGFAERIAAAFGLHGSEVTNHAIGGSIAMHDSTASNCGHWAVMRALGGDALSTTAAGATAVPTFGSTATVTVQTNAAFGATAAFPHRGRLRHTNALGQTQILNYAGVTASTFTFVSGMVRAIASGDLIERVITKRQQRPYLPWPEGENRLCIIGPFADLLAEGASATPKTVSAMRSMISRALAAQVVAEGTSILWALSNMTPIFTAGIHSGDRSYGASQVGGYAEAAFPTHLPPGSVLAVGGLIRQGQTATVEIRVDGVLHGTLVLDALAPAAASEYNSWCYRIEDAAPYTAHTVRVTVSAQGGAGQGIVDWAHVESPVPAPRVLVYGPPDLAGAEATYGATRAEQVAITQAARDAVEALVAEFEHPTLGYNPVGFVDTYEILAGDNGQGDPALYHADVIHPNETGHTLLTESGLTKLGSMFESMPDPIDLGGVL
jgi:hypothetical protein